MAESTGIVRGNQIAAFWHRLPGIARVGILLAIGAMVVWLAWTGIGSLLRQWDPIATGIPDSERARVLEYLRSNNIEYRFEGDSIMVPAEMAQELKIEMAGQDMQVGQLRGLERLETTQMGDTDKTIAAKRQLALQEEIQGRAQLAEHRALLQRQACTARGQRFPWTVARAGQSLCVADAGPRRAAYV